MGAAVGSHYHPNIDRFACALFLRSSADDLVEALVPFWWSVHVISWVVLFLSISRVVLAIVNHPASFRSINSRQTRGTNW